MMGYSFLLRQTWFWVAVILPTLVMAPVLLWPHYGLFSDAGQAIAFPREVLGNLPQSLALLRPLDDGRWNPLFHALTILIYAIQPDSPRALFVAQWFMFVGASVGLAWVIYSFSRSSRLAMITAILFCCGSAVFENFFTLDKVEPRLTIFSALIVVGLTSRLLNDDKYQRWNGYIALQLLLGVLAVFSKETGVYLAAALVATWLACLHNPHWGARPRAVVGVAAATHSIVVIVFIVLFKLLSNEMSYRYVHYDVSAAMVFRNILYYLGTSPELSLGLLCSIYWCLSCLFRRFPGPTGSLRVILVFASMAQMAYVAGLSVWRWPLDYYMLPGQFMASLTLGLTLFVFFRSVHGRSLVGRVVLGLAILIWLVFVSFRVWIGYAIYAQDTVKDQLVQLLSASEWHSARLILPLGHPDNAEIGERLEFFINTQRPPSAEANLYNFWEIPFLNRDNLQRFAGGAGIAPGARQLNDVASRPENHVIWQFGSGANAEIEVRKRQTSAQMDGVKWEPEDIWRANYLRTGDLILLPVGSPLLRLVRARGVSMYARSLEEFLRRTPLQLTRVGGVTSNFWGTKVGWALLRVGQIETNKAKQPYDLSLLFSTNADHDITPGEATDTLFGLRRLPERGLLLGAGWHGLEGSEAKRFRWMGAQSDVILTQARAGTCALNIDMEPALLVGSDPFALRIMSGDRSATYPMQGRQSMHFEFVAEGQPIQVIRLQALGGMSAPPPGDPRLLKARVFSLHLSGKCSEPSTSEVKN
jgi:hypothetical protein